MMEMGDVVRSLIEWSQGKTPPPDEVQIYPTNACNLRCVFCSQLTGMYNIRDDVNQERWIRIANELCDMGVRKVLISGGGEPLLSSATMAMMDIFKKNNLYGRMINNGTMWKWDSTKKAVQTGWDSITFSIDGPNAEIHEKLRGMNGCFKKTVDNIQIFNRYKKRLGSEKPVIGITAVLNRLNYRSVCDMVRLAHDLEIRHLNLEPLCINNPDAEKIKLNEKEREELLTRILPEAERLAQIYKIYTNFKTLYNVKYVEKAGHVKGMILSRSRGRQQSGNETANPFLDLPCYEPWLWPKIEANGDVWPCSTKPLKENIKKKNFAEIWKGDCFNDFRKSIMRKELSESCENCVLSHITTNQMIREQLRDIMSKNG